MILYTRFNPIQACISIESRAHRRMEGYRFDHKWLKDRIELFRHYTYPSVMSQTDQDFEWTGIVHKDSPDWFIDAFEEFPRIKIALVEVDVEVGNPNDITVNLDSDDAIARVFVARAKSHLERDPLCFLKGFKVRISTGTYIPIKANRNSFNIIPAGDKTVLEVSHGAWPNIKVVESEDAFDMWLQPIHGYNIENHLRKPRKSRSHEYLPRVAASIEIEPLPVGWNHVRR